MVENNLAGRRVLITGGGAGIGAALARALVGADARVALLDIDGAAAEATARALGGESAIWRQGDVSAENAADAILGDARARWGGIDDLVNNAGIHDHAPLLDLKPDRSLFKPIAPPQPGDFETGDAAEAKHCQKA